MRRRIIVIAALVVIAGVLVAVPLASAQGVATQPKNAEPQGGIFLHGTVAEVGSDGLLVELPDGAWTVTTDTDGRYCPVYLFPDRVCHSDLLRVSASRSQLGFLLVAEYVAGTLRLVVSG